MRFVAVMLFVLTLCSCASETSFGPCIGLGEDRDPSLVYKASARNLVIGAIFSELLFPPVIVAVNEFYCPVGKRSVSR